MANISNETIQTLTNEGFVLNFYSGDQIDPVKPELADELCLFNHSNDNYDFGLIRVKLPQKKESTYSYIMDKLNTDRVYKSFCENFKTLLPKDLQNSINVYPTTYGIGIFVLLSYRNSTDILKEEIKDILNKKNIDFKTEYSDANYVFRFKISKAKNNIEKI